MSEGKYWQDKYFHLPDRIRYIYKEKLFTDVQIIVTENGVSQVFPGHKALLSSASPYFESTFFGPLANKSDQITLDAINIVAFSSLLSFIYTDELKTDNLEEMLVLHLLADRFLMETLKNICREKIQANYLNSQNVCQVLEHFRIYSDDRMVADCLSIISSDTAAIVASKEFEELSKENLLLILRQDALCVKSEIVLYRAAERWIEGEILRKGLTDEGDKKMLYYEVIREIRFQSMSPDEFPHSHTMAKFLEAADKQRILAVLVKNGNNTDSDGVSGESSVQDKTFPHYFNNKKRELISSPSRSLSRPDNSIPMSLPPDWKSRLHACVAKGDIKNLKRLADAGADVTVKYHNGTTLLHLASHRFKLSVVNYLVERGLNVNSLDGRGFTPLHLAALWGKLEIVEVLLEKGADPRLTNSEGQTPLDLANAQSTASHSQIRALLAGHISRHPKT